MLTKEEEELAMLQVQTLPPQNTISYQNNSPNHYLLALENTLNASQQELERLRNSLHNAQEARVRAERQAEGVRTELINARSNFALQVAEQRVLLIEEIEMKVEERVTESRKEYRERIEATEKRCSFHESNAHQARKSLDSERELRHEKFEEVQSTLKALTKSRSRLMIFFYLLCALFTIGIHYLYHSKIVCSQIQDENQINLLENEALHSNLAHCIATLEEKRHDWQSHCTEAQQNVRTTVRRMMDVHFFAVDLREIAQLHQKIIDAETQCSFKREENISNPIY